MEVGLKCSDLVVDNDYIAAKSFARDLSYTIDEKITAASISGKTYVYHDLPTIIQIGQLPLQDAQLIVYSELVSIYYNSVDSGGKGYPYVKLIKSKDGVQIKIAWRGAISEEDRTRMSALLAKHIETDTKAPSSPRQVRNYQRPGRR